MFQANQGLVASIAKKYVHRGLPYEDLFQEGSLGLLDAIDKYNPESGNRFSTYATNWIRQKIIRSIENGGRTVRIPSRVVQNINHLSDIKYQLLQKLHRDPTLEELANEMNLSVEKIIELENYSKKNVSLDNTVGDDEDASIMDLIPDTNTQDALQVAEKQIKLQEILDELNQLPQRNKEIVEKYFGLNGRKEESLVEIGRDYGFTKERARQIKDDSLREIRKKIDQNI
jgi:RNA polymerase primary sigma factor